MGVGTHLGWQRDKGVTWGSGTALAAEMSTVGAKPSHLEPNPTGMQKPTKAPPSSRHQAVKARKRLFPLKKKKKGGGKPLRAQALCCVKFTALIVPSCTLMRH